MHFGRADTKSFARGTEKEWLVTNGIGGYASSTIIGANTRKYHGLLMAAINPPTCRTLLLAKVEEEVEINNQTYYLSTNETVGGIYPKGFLHIQRFIKSPIPRFTYSIGDIFIDKHVFMVQGQNTTVIRYKILNPHGKKLKLKVNPLVNYRDYHTTIRKNEWPFIQQQEGNGFSIEAFAGADKLHLISDKADYFKAGYWYEGMKYYIEESRGQYCWEDHYMPGYFEVEFKTSGEFSIIASTEPVETLSGALLQCQEEKRLAELVEKAGFDDDFLNRLVVAADTFIVNRESTENKTVIAGYHWFTDWGRDTMIALPGLTLVTKRFEEAKEILRTFAKSCKDGLIPNRFPDCGEEADYNTVDASLWFFHAVFKYLEYTRDWAFVRTEIYPTLKKIVKCHIQGTHFNIKMDSDGLIVAGTRETQLTWMDAKVGDWVITPREGKPVEINALWYNALRTMILLAQEFGDDIKMEYSKLAAKVKESFGRNFWNDDKKCLYDVVNGDHKDDSVRPNQILAVALPFTLLEHYKELLVVKKVWNDLYTTYGLRSLSPEDQEYKGSYQGDQVSRDAAYHQGTAWSWLIGPFVTAFRKVNDYSPDSRLTAEKFLAPFKDHLNDAGIGAVSEIFEGDMPYQPKGCVSQAWGVAEVLRAQVEEVLEERPPSLWNS